MVVLLVVGAGCVGGEPRLDRPPEIVFSGTMNASADGIQMDGVIEEEGGVDQKNAYRDVVVCLYGADKERLYRTVPVDMEPPRTEATVSIETDAVPKYVVLNSSDFWDVPDISVLYYVRTTVDGESTFMGKFAYSPEELPVQNCSADAAQ